jgi:glutathione peroxidase
MLNNRFLRFFDLEIEDLEGNNLDIAAMVGKKVMLVNVASACGYTPQYKQLQELYEACAGKLVIIAMPCNDFGRQEPGDAASIRNFCDTKYKVTFPITQKVQIKQDPHPVIEWLCHKDKNGQMDADISWNFCKFLIDETGKLSAFYPSSTSPLDEKILNWLDISIDTEA